MPDDNLSEQARLIVLAAYGDPHQIPSRERLTAATDRLDAAVGALTKATALTAPDAAEVERACAALSSAATARADAEGAADALAGDRVQFLETSLEFRDRHGTQPCPVCAEGTLDDAWVARARAALTAEQDAASALRMARSAAHRARQALVALAREIDTPPAENAELTTIAAARLAYEAFSALPVDDDPALAEHVASTLPDLRTAYQALRAEAGSTLEAAHEAQTWLRALAPAVQP
ncbi:hypothetical protein [Mycolicibacterium sp.]|uniref:hypothetical protein n=1 Tax=Mycolicibacterium sp. TaxID=2320850 RepID=UPI001A36117B|nr:hypothetical protein [Mycolicibacterium sp.]MBJ7336696.1 hypothetical protein [Mycolicibacterium sp.]